MAGERLIGIFRAARQVTAGSADEWRERVAINLHQAAAEEPRQPSNTGRKWRQIHCMPVTADWLAA